MNAAAIMGVVKKIELMKASRRDYIWPTSQMILDNEGRMILESQGKLFRVHKEEEVPSYFSTWQEAEAHADKTEGSVSVEKGSAVIGMDTKARTQLVDKVGMPVKYYNQLVDMKLQELASFNVNTLLGNRPLEKVMVRSFLADDGLKIRAILSNRYRCLDNYDLFLAAADTFRGCNATMWTARTWGSGEGFELFGVSEEIQQKIRIDRTFDRPDHFITKFGDDGDVNYAAVRVSNSETGAGGLSVTMSMMRAVCNNLCVWGNRVSQIHLEKRKEEEGLIMSDDRSAAEANVIWLKIRDAIKTAFSKEAFEKYVAKMNDLTQIEIKSSVPETVKAVLADYPISKTSIDSIIGELLGSGDLSAYGIVQAVTAQAHTSERSGNFAAASEFCEIGGKVADFSRQKFNAIMENVGV
jgi:hypothetical protein